MFLRALFAGTIALLLGGCVGWAAESRLIPVAERATVGLAGTYVPEDEGSAVLIAPGKDGFVRLTDPAGDNPPIDVAFDMLREEPPELSPYASEPTRGEDAAPSAPRRSYLVEFPIEADEGKTVYTYAIVRIDGDQPAGSFELFIVLCSKATEALAARKEGKVCIFDNYDSLRAAAMDALAWQDEARMAVDGNIFRFRGETDVLESEGF